MTASESKQLPMPKFGEVTSCPKCGYDPAGTIRTIATRPPIFKVRYCGPRDPLKNCSVNVGSAEHLHRWCLRCAYEWLEHPLDRGG